MSLGSPAVGSSLALAIKLVPARGHPRRSADGKSCPEVLLRKRREVDAAENDDADQATD